MCVLLVSALVLLVASASAVSESHYETYTYTYYTSTWSCFLTSYYYCNNWFYYPYYYGWYYYGCYWYYPYSYYGWCYPRQYQNCYYVYTLRSATGTRCQTGWTGANCDIAICNNPTCTGGQSCVSPNSCSCLASGTGSKCSNVPCTATNNCYPGTCNAGSCTCPSGFSGPNCATISFVPIIESCSAKINGRLPSSATEQVVAQSTDCTAPGVNRKTIWIPTNSLTNVQVSWLAKYQNPVALPNNNDAPFISNAPVSLGIARSTFTVDFQSGYKSPAVYCPSASFSTSNTVPSTADCSNIVQTWTNLQAGTAETAHNKTFTIGVEAWIGARKTSSDSYTGIPTWGRGFQPQDFTSNNSTMLQMTFGFDLRPPVHCLTVATSNNCSIFPIYMNETLTQNPKIQPTFNAWTDDASGIDRFHIDVFYMQPNSVNKLVELGDPVFQADVSNTDIGLDKVQFTVSVPGTYAIHLTVYDQANNTAKARKIFTYLGNASLTVSESAFHIDKADPATDYKYITTLETPQNNMPYQFTALWPNVFTSNIDPKWGLGVNPWLFQTNTIDDSYGMQFGLRSIDALTLTGVMSYQFAFVIDKNGGIGVNTPSNFTNINDTTVNQFSFQIAQNMLQSGDTIVTWVRAYSRSTALYTVKTQAYIDTCKYCVNVTVSRIQYQTVDQYTTSLFVTVVSKIGGISNITCDIYDSTKKVAITSLVAPVATRDPPSSAQRKKRGSGSKPCLQGDDSCYCTALGQCYDVTQVINIDNCLIDKFDGDTLTLTYTITSLTGHVISNTIQMQVRAQNIQCRPQPGISGGAIAGIIIACIIGLLILVLLIIMLVRSRVQHKHPLPMRVRTMASDVRSKFVGQTTAVSVNEIYEGKSAYFKGSNNTKVTVGKKVNSFAEDDIYGPAIENPDWKISEKDVQLGDVVAEGRFAVVRKAYLTRRNEQTTVAAKTLKSGYKTSDIGLMRLKIQFLAKEIRPHKNIVKFIGAVDEDASIPPLMIMELCDMALKDWLASIKNVSVDVLESMLTFTLNIAQGMEHLHSIKITHRRLAARNVLLKVTPGGLEARLIGLDPAFDDGDGEEGGAGQSTVPIKWLAPETLATLSNKIPTYDERTDVWSFGVTVWEIYSQGQTPYPKEKSNDVRALIQRGHRLSCPTHCPPDLFETVVSPCWNAAPKKRPRFKAVVSSIEAFRNGSSGEGGLYYAANEGDQRQDNEMYVDAR